MISKSTKAKRRKNHIYYKMVKTILIELVDKRVNFFIVSLPRTKNFSIHLEARGTQQVRKQYINMLEKCRKFSNNYSNRLLEVKKNNYISLKCGNDVIVFNKERQKVAKGKAVASYDGQVSVELMSGKLYDELMKHPGLLINNNLKYTLFHFSEISGRLIGFNFLDKPSAEVEKLLKGIRAVNEVDFRYGMVNSWFISYPGFGLLLTQE